MIVAGLLLVPALAIAEPAEADTTNWWDEITKIPNFKVGYIGINTAHDDHILGDTEGLAWDMAASIPVFEWRKFDIDGGISKSGLVYGAITFDVIELNDISAVNVPGSEFIKINVGIFVGKDADAIDGVEWADDWTIGAVVNLAGL